jgi:hypothetical protein
MGNKSWIALGAAAVAAMAAMAPAHAGGAASIHLNIGTAPSYYGHGYPNYSQPAYVYSQPGYVYSQPGYGYSQPYYGGRGHRHGGHYGHGYRRDMDRDGVPNRWDRDRDGDGVPNRHDRRPHNPYRY